MSVGKASRRKQRVVTIESTKRKATVSTIGIEVIKELKSIRLEEGTTLDEVARRMDLVHKSSIHSIERGGNDPKIGTLQRYARALGYDLEVLLIPIEE